MSVIAATLDQNAPIRFVLKTATTEAFAMVEFACALLDFLDRHATSNNVQITAVSMAIALMEPANATLGSLAPVVNRQPVLAFMEHVPGMVHALAKAVGLETFAQSKRAHTTVTLPLDTDSAAMEHVSACQTGSVATANDPIARTSVLERENVILLRPHANAQLDSLVSIVLFPRAR